MKTPSVVINTDTKEAKYKGKSVTLPPKELGILESLAKVPGRVIARSELLETVWGIDAAIGIQDTRTVDQHIARLRKRTGRDVVETIPTHGYRSYAVRIENIRDNYGKVSHIRREYGSKPYVTFRVTVPGDVVPTLTEGQKIKVA